MPSAVALADRLAAGVGAAVRDERSRRALTTRQLAERARVSPATVNAVESGQRTSLDVYARVATALGLSLHMAITDGRRRQARERADLVHAAMGELEASFLAAHGYVVAVDHPYQHYQFAGRADVMAWSMDQPALLHLENRTRFPDLQEAAGAFNAKCQYLAPVVARQLDLPRFASQTHVMVALWSAEVLHALRLRPATFRALCPDPAAALRQWLAGVPPTHGMTRTLVLLDPLARGRRRPFIDLEEALAGARPRVRGYAEAAASLRARRLA